jgi:hypothetical protein
VGPGSIPLRADSNFKVDENHIKTLIHRKVKQIVLYYIILRHNNVVSTYLKLEEPEMGNQGPYSLA